jgi:hypothetical protein
MVLLVRSHIGRASELLQFQLPCKPAATPGFPLAEIQLIPGRCCRDQERDCHTLVGCGHANDCNHHLKGTVSDATGHLQVILGFCGVWQGPASVFPGEDEKRTGQIGSSLRAGDIMDFTLWIQKTAVTRNDSEKSSGSSIIHIDWLS